MTSPDWHITGDLTQFLTRAGEFLRSRPALHTVHLTVTEALRSRGSASTVRATRCSGYWNATAKYGPPSSAPRPAA